MTTPHQRLERMRNSFEKNKSISSEDYEHFTTAEAPAMPHESIPPNKAARKSAGRSGQQSQEQSETRSSDRIGD